MKYQDELIEIIIEMQEKGFDHDFTIESEHIRCLQYDELIPPDAFEIMEARGSRLISGQGGNVVIYGIRLKEGDIKGILLSNHSLYASGMSRQLSQKFDGFLKSTAAITS